MITVAIMINGRPIMARSAVNTAKTRRGKTVYRLDTGKDLLHNPDDGAVKLAKMMLDSIEDYEIYRRNGS